MYKSAFSIVLFLSVAWAGCNRVDDSLSGRCIYAGKIYLVDSLTGSKQLVETDSVISVKLYRGRDANNFLYEKKTQGKGDFALDFLEKNTEYRIRASLKMNNVSYAGDTTFFPTECDRKYYLNLLNDTVKLVLYASVAKRNVVSIVVVDRDSMIVPRAEACLFSSRSMFDTRTCLNANHTTTGNEAGKLTFSNIEAGTYYLYVNKRLDTLPNASVLTGIDSFMVPSSGIVTRKLKIE